MDVTVNIRHGDSTQYERKMMLENIPQLLITTLKLCKFYFLEKK
jgi:Lhr-like helicases